MLVSVLCLFMFHQLGPCLFHLSIRLAKERIATGDILKEDGYHLPTSYDAPEAREDRFKAATQVGGRAG